MRTMMRVLKCTLLSLCLISGGLLAQEGQTGTVQSMEQDNGFIVISDRRVGFADGITQVYWQDQLVGAETLDQGMVVRYTVNAQGVLMRVDILGPAAMMQALELN